MSNKLLVLALSLSISSFAMGDQIPPARYMELIHWLKNRFNWEENAVAIPSYDCEISLQRTNYNSVTLSVRRTGWKNYASIAPFYDIEFVDRGNEISIKHFAEECEEEGCDGFRHLQYELTIGNKILELTQYAAYTHQKTTTSCILAPAN